MGLALLVAFTALFVTAFHAPRPHDIDVGVVGSPASAAQVDAALARMDPGAFAVRAYPSERAARDGLRDADVRGVLVPGAAGDRILVAGAHGAAPTAVVTAALSGAAKAQGRRAVVRDVVPLPRHDSLGLSSFFTVVATVIPSLAFGVLLSLLGRGLPARARWAAVGVFAVLAGLLVAFTVDTVIGALTGEFWGLAGVVALLALAVASLSSGLVRLLGPAGVALAAAVVLLVGQSSAGGAIGYEFLPAFYRALSQLLPSGAALTALRDTVYFGGAHTVTPLLVLAAWAAAGIGLGLLGERRRQPERRTP